MSLLGFKKQFAGPVERREKRQTIRAKVSGHAVGRPIQLYTGLRTKACRKLAEVDPVCTSIEPIGIDTTFQGVVLDGVELGARQIADMAMADGFPTFVEFFDFFTVEGEPVFRGFLIRWDWP